MESDEERVERETDAAAAEAGDVGGRRPEDEADSPDEPVREGGGGEAEGFEEAEELLREHAEHQEPGGDPLVDQGETEPERDDAAHGEADRVQPADE
jgi:hypothetical protein